jgi:hypothetical protein
MRLGFRTLLIAAIISVSSVTAGAEELASGHYFPGALSSFIDLLPLNTGSSTIGISNDSIYYHGSSNHANGTVYANSWALLYQFPTPISILPGAPQYSVALGVPYIWLKANGPVVTPKVIIPQKKVTENGFGDVEVFPFMLGWTKLWCTKEGCNGGSDKQDIKYTLKYQTQFGVYAPTGNFQHEAPATIGKNYWTFEPGAAVDFLRWPCLKTDPIPYFFEFTASAGLDFNSKNNATHYQTGDQFHLDGTLALDLPLSTSDVVGAGASGFFYQQITRDSGSGDLLGGFEALTTGVGPTVSYAGRVDLGKDYAIAVAAQVQWLPELSVRNRAEGNIVLLKLALSWGAAPKCPGKPAPFASTVRSLFSLPPPEAASVTGNSLYTLASF